MTVCFDIYTMPSGCGVIQTYPSAPHPPSDMGAGGSRRHVRAEPRRKKKRHVDTDEDILAVLGLL